MVAGDPPQPNKRSTFQPEKFLKNLMTEKEKKAKHELTVTEKVHKPTAKILVSRKQPTPAQPTVGFKQEIFTLLCTDPGSFSFCSTSIGFWVCLLKLIQLFLAWEVIVPTWVIICMHAHAHNHVGRLHHCLLSPCLSLCPYPYLLCFS